MFIWVLPERHLRPRPLDLIEFGLQLRDPPKLNIEITTNGRQGVAVLFENFSSLVQHLDHAIELVTRHTGLARLRNSRNAVAPPPRDGRELEALLKCIALEHLPVPRIAWTLRIM